MLITYLLAVPIVFRAVSVNGCSAILHFVVTYTVLHMCLLSLYCFLLVFSGLSVNGCISRLHFVVTYTVLRMLTPMLIT